MTASLTNRRRTQSVASNAERAAWISSCETYRYFLSRRWDKKLPVLAFIMLNPSTADAYKDDPTIVKCIGFAQRWGYGAIEIANLYAYRSTSPEKLWTVSDPYGPDNDGWILTVANRAKRIVAAWGSNMQAQGRAKAVLANLAHCDVYALKVTYGPPWHPLYVPYAAEPVMFQAGRSMVR